MNEIEVSRLAKCEEVIERGLHTFVDVGNALLEIRDNRLYREKYSTFEDYCKDRWGWQRNYANKLIASAEVVTNLGTIVPILPVTESQARPLTPLEPDLQIEAWQRAVETAPETGITAKHVQSVVDEIQNKPHVSFNSGENEWYTPVEYIESARRVMGGIDTDPASSELANKTVSADKFYTTETDGLANAWTGNVWMNPPYSQPLITEFTSRLVEKYNTGEFDQACVLVNNATETQFFQLMLACCSAVCFVKGRIKFIDKYGNPSGAPLQGQAVIYFGGRVSEFANEFSKYGKVLYG